MIPPSRNARPQDHVLLGVTELVGSSGPDDYEEKVRPGPLRRHALWGAGIAVLGVGLGRASALFRTGPEEYGLPPAAPGTVRPYLVAWTATGLAAAAVLRAAAAVIRSIGGAAGGALASRIQQWTIVTPMPSPAASWAQVSPHRRWASARRA
ncbi:hypothetical protein GCM10010446_30080 [Streptomyces enissocaesilis]|uniref:Uncharacterized protein n=1 Tax=Streptomyces enissocaesilis TaxID=332589 RepID=A0ABN3X979_9ACTN